MKRYLTYDVCEKNDYTKAYELFAKMKAKKITESTYEIDSSLSQHDFVELIKSVFHKGDNVAYITSNKQEGTFYSKIII